MTIFTRLYDKIYPYSGFTLIEVMIAVFILTVCLLGFTGVYINVLNNTQNTYRTSVKNLINQDQINSARIELP